MLSETHIIANAKLQNVFGSLKVIISSDSNTKLVSISIDYVGRSSSRLIILTYNLHIQHNLNYLLACLIPQKASQGPRHTSACVQAHTRSFPVSRLFHRSSSSRLNVANDCMN